MSTDNGSTVPDRNKLATALGTDATRIKTDTMSVSELEIGLGKEALTTGSVLDEELSRIAEQIAARYPNSENTQDTITLRAEQIMDLLEQEDATSFGDATGELLKKWCNRTVGTSKTPRPPSRSTLSQRKWATRAIVNAAFDAVVISETKRDELLNALPKRKTGPPLGTSSAGRRADLVILRGAAVEHSHVGEEDLQQVMKQIRHSFRDRPGALREQEPKARDYLRWQFGFAAPTWNDIEADHPVRYWQGRILPAPGVRRPTRLPTSEAPRRRAVTAVIEAAVELGYLSSDHEAVLACRQAQGPRVADNSTDSADIEAAVRAWRPRNWSPQKLQQLEEVRPVICEWVLCASPASVKKARTSMGFVAEATVRQFAKTGQTDPEVVFHPQQIEAAVAERWSDRYSQDNVIAELTRVGREVAPRVQPTKTRTSRRKPPPEPYGDREEEAFRIAAQNAGLVNRAARMWLTAATFGAGLNGPEAVAAGPGDIEPLGQDGLAVRVTGRNDRLVPVRNSYVDLVRQAIKLAEGQRFLATKGRYSASGTAFRLQVEGLGSLDIRRARATWICAHLRAGTRLGHFRKICGPVNANTLTDLLRTVADEIDEQDAALMGRIP